MFLNRSNFFFDSGLLFWGTNILEKNINSSNLHFFLGRRKAIFIVDFRKYIYIFRIALFYIYRLICLRGKILGFDDRIFIRRCLIFFFNRANQFYIAKNWIGGTLTNFKNFKRFFSQISKGFRSLKQYYHIFIHFYGLKTNQRLPSLIIFSNPNPSSIGSLQESFRIGIPSFSIVNIITTQNYGITFPLPCNGEDFEALFLFHNIIGDVLLFGWIKPVVNFFSNFIKRLKKIRKINYLINTKGINNYYSAYYQEIFKKNLFLSNVSKQYIFYFLKKFKLLNLNFYFLQKKIFKKFFKKKFFKKSFILRWFLKKVLKRRKIKKKKKRKIIKRIFKYKIKKKKKRIRRNKKKNYKIF